MKEEIYAVVTQHAREVHGFALRRGHAFLVYLEELARWIIWYGPNVEQVSAMRGAS